MVYKRYESPFEKPKNTVHTPPPKPQEFKKEKPRNQVSLGFIDKLSNDDIILIALIIILLAEDKEKRDVPLILTLGFLFLIQYIDAD